MLSDRVDRIIALIDDVLDGAPLDDDVNDSDPEPEGHDA